MIVAEPIENSRRRLGDAGLMFGPAVRPAVDRAVEEGFGYVRAIERARHDEVVAVWKSTTKNVLTQAFGTQTANCTGTSRNARMPLPVHSLSG